MLGNPIQLPIQSAGSYKPMRLFGGGKGQLLRGPGGGLTSAINGSSINEFGGQARPGSMLQEQRMGMSAQAAQNTFQAMGAYGPQAEQQVAPQIPDFRRRLLQHRY